jgi:hypothetical protein
MKLYTDKPTICLAGPVRFSYVNLFKPRKNDLSGKTEYSVVLMIPKSPHQFQSDGKAEGAGITSCIKAAAADMFGKDVKGYKNPLKDGDIEKNGEGLSKYPGHWFITVKTGEEYPPMIIDGQRIPLGADSLEQKRMQWQSGDWGKAKISFKGYDLKGVKGVAAYLSAIQFIHKDEPFGNATSVEEFDMEETASPGVEVSSETDPFADE